MQNYWIFYSIGGLLALGLGDFIKKVIIQKGGQKEVFLFICFVFYLILLGINFFINGNFEITDVEKKGALIIGIFDAFIPIGVLTAFKYLEVSFALIFIRIISSIAVLIIGMQILGDNLNTANIIGFGMGIITIYLLSGFNFSKDNKFNLKGILAVSLTTISIIGSHSYFKYVVSDINVDNFMILKFMVSFTCIIIYMLIRGKFREFSKKQVKLVTPLAFLTSLTSIIFVLQFLYFLPHIYLNGPLSLSYKILSYSLIVPIILSIIFYKEKITKRKIIAFILTIVSLGLFIV